MAEHLTARTVITMGLLPQVDLAKPIVVKLGLWDDRVVNVKCWSTRDGHLVLTLADTSHFEQQTSADDNKRRRSLRGEWPPYDYGKAE